MVLLLAKAIDGWEMVEIREMSESARGQSLGRARLFRTAEQRLSKEANHVWRAAIMRAEARLSSYTIHMPGKRIRSIR